MSSRSFQVPIDQSSDIKYSGSLQPSCGTTVLVNSASTAFTQYQCWPNKTSAGLIKAWQVARTEASTTTAAANQLASSTAQKNHRSSPNHTGAIAGGVGAGVGGVAILGAIVAFLVWRKRKQRVQALPEISQVSHSKKAWSERARPAEQSTVNLPEGA